MAAASSQAATRSIYLDSALHVVKGALVKILKIPTARTTLTVQHEKQPAHSGSITIGQVGKFEKALESKIQEQVNEKVAENVQFHVFKMARKHAEELYGETMYDQFKVPDTVQELRLVRLPSWNLNCQINPVLESTILLGKVELTKFTFNAEKQTLKVTVQCTPVEGEKATQAEERPLYPPQAECEPADESQVINPVDVQADAGIDYDKLVRDFGCSKIDASLIQRIERITGKRAHRFLRRGLFFTHRDLDILLDQVEKGVPFYLYTGRGASSESLHIGHLVPFFFTKWLQDTFDVPLVIQLTDDEKSWFKENISAEEAHKLAYANIKDIIACGFNPEKTFIFTNFDYMGTMYPLVAKIAKKITFNQAKGALGLTDSANIGKCFYTAVQAAPSFPEAFPHIFGGRTDVRCLIPQAIDQDPFFRVTRDIAPRLNLQKPALIHSKFFPALQGHTTKMSSSADTPSTIFVTDSEKQIKDKVMKYALSGGGQTLEEHREKGANLDVDVPYEYLRYVLEDDEEFKKIGEEYGSGRMTTGEVKNKLVAELKLIVNEHRERRKLVTDEVVRQFMDPCRETLKYF
ncbi:unnamed protein product [Amoebophrya sp. A120]|nr:unnamed protein product [Amoebophrya sp. A120]|eukprot:GSA120T00013453001.1